MSSVSRPGDLLIQCSKLAHNITIAAPYIKSAALRKFLRSAYPAASLTCITRWKPLDLAIGASDLSSREIVNEFGGSFRLHPSLHAKYYRMEQTVLIGSANLTCSAMGWSPESNLEILVQAGEEFDYLSFEKQLLGNSKILGDREFSVWAAMAELMARDAHMVTDKQPRLDDWRPLTRDPAHLFLSCDGRDQEIASADERESAQRDLEALRIPPGLTAQQSRTWITACLLTTPFVCSVMRLDRDADLLDSYRSIARTYGLDITEARRATETVENWLAFFSPETL